MKKVLYTFSYLAAVIMLLSVTTLHAQVSRDFESNNIGDTFTGIGWNAATDVQAVVADDPVASGNKVLRNTIGNYNAAPVLMFVLPAGQTLADYTSFTFKSYWAQGDVGFKTIIAEAYPSRPTAQAYNNNAVRIGEVARNAMGSTAWEDITIDITGAAAYTATLSDTVYIAFGINCAGTGSVGGAGSTTIWYADDVTLAGASAPSDGGLLTEWGAMGRYGWPIINSATEGSVATGGTGNPPAGNWASVRGGFDLTATESEALVVTGKLEFVGGGATSWSALRYGVYNTPAAEQLFYAGTDTARWGRTLYAGTDSARFDADQTSTGYLFTPNSGVNVAVTGVNGAGSVWANNGAGWLTTQSGVIYPIGGVVDPAPSRAEMTPGVYDWAISVQPQADGSNEVRWYIQKEDRSFWLGGITNDTSAAAVTFNGVIFAINNGNDIASTGLTRLNLSEVTAQLGEPIEVPEAPWQSYYVEDWGAMGRYGWPILKDTLSIVGDASMGGTGNPPQGNWASLRGGFRGSVSASESRAIIVRGEIEFVGGGPTSWSALRYGLFNTPAASSLFYANTDSARWGRTLYAGTDSARFDADQTSTGYLITPVSGSNTMVTGVNGAGSVWANNGAGWLTTQSGVIYPTGPVVDQVPALAEMTEGTYEWAISVQPLANGSNEIRWYMIKDDESFWWGGTQIDTSGAATDFNGVIFAINNGNDIGTTNLTRVNLIAVEVDLGDPIDVPTPPFEAFWVSKWGETARGTGWRILNDSTTFVGDASMGGDGPPTAWATIRGGFDYDVEATTSEAIIVSGQLEFVGGGMEDQYTPIRYALTYDPTPGELINVNTDSAFWNGSGNANTFGYAFMPISGNGQLANGTNGAATTWSVNGAAWNTTYNGNVWPIQTVEQAPAGANMVEGTYDFAFSVRPLPNGTNEVRYLLVEENNRYWYAGIAIDSLQVTTKFNGVAFGIINGLDNGMTEFKLYEVRVEKGDPIDIPVAPFEDMYLSQWGFIGANRINGWTLTPGDLDGNVSISGTAGGGWHAVRGEFTAPVSLRADTSLVITGEVELVGGGFEDFGALRFGVFQSDSAGTLDSTANGYEWSGSPNSSGYLFLPNSGTNVIPQFNGTPGTVGATTNGDWISTNTAGAKVLSDDPQWRAGVVGSAGTYDFAISITPMGANNEIRYHFHGGDYNFTGIVVDTNAVTQRFNSVNFAINNATTTGLNLIDVHVDLGPALDPSLTPVEQDPNSLPNQYALEQNYPNPFNPTTKISFSVPQTSEVSLVVYDALGAQVAELVKGSYNPGKYDVNFNASNLASGVYFYKLKAGDFVSVKKLMLLK